MTYDVIVRIDHGTMCITVDADSRKEARQMALAIAPEGARVKEVGPAI